MKQRTIIGTAAVLVWMAFVPMTAPVKAQGGASQDKLQIASGQQAKIEGLIVKRNPDSLIVRDQGGRQVAVILNDLTEVKEKKKNPFRRANNYATTQLLRGLNVEVEGRGDDSGNLIARKIQFTQTELRIARSVESRVTPVEAELQSTGNRIGEDEQKIDHMSGQIDELSAVSNAARGGAKAAQETADAAIEGLKEANSHIVSNHAAVNSRISDLDDYQVKENMVVRFKVGSAVLSDEAREALDSFARQAKSEKGYMIEIAGFASADGGEARNLALSRKRADAVVQYLVMQHQVPLRRMITPFGYGETMPVADNSTRTGREENRRVEVKVLVNKGLVEGDKAADGNVSAASNRP